MKESCYPHLITCLCKRETRRRFDCRKEEEMRKQKQEVSVIQERGYELRNLSGFQRVKKKKAKGQQSLPRAEVPSLCVMTPLEVQ